MVWIIIGLDVGSGDGARREGSSDVAGVIIGRGDPPPGRAAQNDQLRG